MPLQNTERRYEQTFADARKPISTSGAGGAGVDTEGLRKDAHGNIEQVLPPNFSRSWLVLSLPAACLTSASYCRLVVSGAS